MKFHVKPKVVFHYVSRETSIQALLCTLRTKSRLTHRIFTEIINLTLRADHNVTGILSTLTRRMAEAELDIGSIRPNHLKYELSLSSKNDQLILNTNMHRCSQEQNYPRHPIS